MSRPKMLDSLEIELTRVRRMAEQAANSLLLYLIDMAIPQSQRRNIKLDPVRTTAQNPMFSQWSAILPKTMIEAAAVRPLYFVLQLAIWQCFMSFL